MTSISVPQIPAMTHAYQCLAASGFGKGIVLDKFQLAVKNYGFHEQSEGRSFSRRIRPAERRSGLARCNIRRKDHLLHTRPEIPAFDNLVAVVLVRDMDICKTGL